LTINFILDVKYQALSRAF